MMTTEHPDRNEISGPPLQVLERWVAAAEATGADSPRCFTLATASPDGVPHARTVLSTVIDDASVRFNTSRPSVKTADLAANPRAAGVFFWPGLIRQVTVHGRVVEVAAERARAAYPEQSPNLRALAWVHDELGGSAPGTPVDPARVRAAFDAWLARDPRDPPSSWISMALVPEQIEFWWIPAGAEVATKARFDRSPDGSWIHHFVLP